jgi:uncharacterized protein YegL
VSDDTVTTGDAGPPLLLPLYLLVDTSGSMGGGPLGAINAELLALDEDLDWRVVDALRLSVVGFADDASTIVPLGDLADIEMPALKPGGGTNYKAAFDHLLDTLPTDWDVLAVAKRHVDRPVVVLLSDGGANDGAWEPALSSLCAAGRPWSPTVLAVGIGDAATDTLLTVVQMAGGRSCALVARKGLPLIGFLPDLVRALVRSPIPDLPAFDRLGS